MRYNLWMMNTSFIIVSCMMLLSLYIMNFKSQDLYIQFIKKIQENLKNKNNDLLEKYDRLTQVNESLCCIASQSSSLEDLKNKDDIIRKQVEDLPSTLAKFTSFITIHLSAAKINVCYKYY